MLVLRCINFTQPNPVPDRDEIDVPPVRHDGGMSGPAPAPLLGSDDLDRLRDALAEYTTDGVHERLGVIGRAAHERGDLDGVARTVRGTTGRDHLSPDGDAVGLLIRLFLLGDTLPTSQAARALHPLPLATAVAAGLVDPVDADHVRAGLEIRPYGEAPSSDQAGHNDVGAALPTWWVVSDPGSDIRPGSLDHEHVLGIGNAALSLAQATPRTRVGRALDIGTGCGVQALHLGRHAARVTATDISRRALRCAATTAALSGQDWDLREGSLLEPVARERFDLVVANPPFVVSPGEREYEYRDSGMAGDALCRRLVAGLPTVLNPGGTAQLLANWIVPATGDWRERLVGWFPHGVEAWVWQRETADLGEYVALWLRDAGHRPGTETWSRRYDAWLDWFTANDVVAVGMGLITMWRTEDTPTLASPGRGANPRVIVEDVPQAHENPIGAEIASWHDRYRMLARTADTDLLRSRFAAAKDLVRERADLIDPDGGWRTARETLRQSHGMRWRVEVDEAVGRIVAACAGGATPAAALDLLAATTDDDPDRLGAQFAPVLRDLVQRGVLVPVEGRSR